MTADGGATLAERVSADGVRFLLALFVDLTGKPCAKLVPVACAEQVQAEGSGSPATPWAPSASSRATPT